MDLEVRHFQTQMTSHCHGFARGGRGATQGHLAEVSLGFSMFTDLTVIVVLGYTTRRRKFSYVCWFTNSVHQACIYIYMYVYIYL